MISSFLVDFDCDVEEGERFEDRLLQLLQYVLLRAQLGIKVLAHLLKRALRLSLAADAPWLALLSSQVLSCASLNRFGCPAFESSQLLHRKLCL